jgi:CRP-like cAMP-binding protein
MRYVNGRETVSFPAGSVIFNKDDPGTAMYIIAAGEVELAYDEQRSVRIGPGESFGEMALIDRRPRSTGATAATDVELHSISQGLFLVLTQETPYFALEVMQSLTERLRDLYQRG